MNSLYFSHTSSFHFKLGDYFESRYARFFAPDVRAVLKKYDKKRRLVELSLVTLAKGESDEPLELLPDGSYARLNTSAA